MNLTNKKNYIISLLSFTILITLLISCSTNDTVENKNIETNSVLVSRGFTNTVDIERFKNSVTPFPISDVYNSPQAKESMVIFVNSISAYYVQGMTFQDFKYSLDPIKGLVNIKPEGDLLLQEGYNYIVGNVTPSRMSGTHIINAYFSGLEYYEQSSNHPLDFNLLNDNDYDLIFANLFGLDVGNNLQVATNGDGCKWYQLGCHTKWLTNVIVSWWNTPATGTGSMTNGQVVATFTAALVSVTTLVILLL